MYLFTSCKYSTDNDQSLLQTGPELEWELCFRARTEMYLPDLCGKSCAASTYNTVKLSQAFASFNLMNLFRKAKIMPDNNKNKT